MSILYIIGYYGPVYLFILAGLLSAWQGGLTLASLFTAWQFLSHISNYLLKALIRQPRPPQANADGLEQLHDYGMPSGHAQAAVSLFVFIAAFALTLDLNSLFAYILIAISLIIVAFTCVQRVVYHRHTVAQVTVGSLVGVLSGYLFLMLLNSKSDPLHQIG